jgi:hypothetical protein
MAASMTQRQILKFGAEKPTVHADMAALASGYLRDLAVARDGNVYVTSFTANASGPDDLAAARILLAMPDGSIRSVADNLAHPSGRCARNREFGTLDGNWRALASSSWLGKPALNRSAES